MGRTRQAAIFSGKTEKNPKLRENFKRLDETKPKKRRSEHGKRRLKGKTRGKKGNVFGSKKQRKKSSKRGKADRATKYYLEDGKYEENENFERWADKLRRMWEKVYPFLEYFW